MQLEINILEETRKKSIKMSIPSYSTPKHNFIRSMICKFLILTILIPSSNSASPKTRLCAEVNRVAWMELSPYMENMTVIPRNGSGGIVMEVGRFSVRVSKYYFLSGSRISWTNISCDHKSSKFVLESNGRHCVPNRYVYLKCISVRIGLGRLCSKIQIPCFFLPFFLEQCSRSGPTD